MLEGGFLTIAVRHAFRQLRHLGDESLIFVAPIENDLELVHQPSFPGENPLGRRSEPGSGGVRGSWCRVQLRAPDGAPQRADR